MRKIEVILVILLCWFGDSLGYDESFGEELLVTPLRDGKVMVHFQFTLTRPSRSSPHFNLFPKPIQQLIEKYYVRELHLSFTQGRWMYERWGYPTHPAPVGVQLWSWFRDDNSGYSIDSRWEGLKQALAGLFCASLQFMDSTITAQPKLTFRPEGYHPAVAHLPRDNRYVRYATLPREAVCTENLTPWLKLLPCRRQAGISQLLSSPQMLYDVQFHSMGTHVVPRSRANCNIGDENEFCDELELSQTLSLVFSPHVKTGKMEFNLKTLFGVGEIKRCPLASLSRVYVAVPLLSKDSPLYKIESPLNSSKVITPPSMLTQSREYFVYDLLQSTASFSLKVIFSNNSMGYGDSIPLTPISVNRFLTGYGRQKGGIALHIANHLTTSVDIRILQLVPWYLQLYFHTLHITINNIPIPQKQLFRNGNHIMYITPGEDRKTPSQMEFMLTLEANSSFGMEILFDKTILHFFEYPPDPNRGFDIGPLVVQVTKTNLTCEDQGIKLIHLPPLHFVHQNQNETQTIHDKVCYNLAPSQSLYMYTTGLSVMLPTPDFSMPYNVITLTCTVIAFFFGQVIKILIRRYSDVFKSGKFVSNRPIVQAVNKIMALASKKSDEESKDDESNDDKSKEQ